MRPQIIQQAVNTRTYVMTLRSLMQAGPAKANELFAKLSETSDGAVKTRERLFAELQAELEFHTSLEEQHLFPVLRRSPETKDLVADAIRDNKELRAKVAELDGMAKNDAIFSEHARDDRKELLPAVQRALSEEQVQGVTDKMEAGIAEAEQAKQDEAEERRAKARQEREEAEFLARQAELREQQDAKAEREQAAAEQRVRAQARQVADAALKPVAAMAKTVDEAARQTNATFGAKAGRTQSPALDLTYMFLWPWLTAMQNGSTKARGVSGMEEVVPLGEEVLEVGKRTENRGTARIRRFVVETPIERQVTLQSERVVVERRRPVSDKVTGEILTEVTVEIVETEEVPTVEKRLRLREEIVVRTERAQRIETVKETVRRDEVEIQQPSRKRGSQNSRLVTTEG
jgi:stress response protein YsnF